MSPLGVTATTGCAWPFAQDGRPAITHYRVLERFRAHTFLSVKLETGRTHQIRVHLAHLHFPIVGDPVYGGRFERPRARGDGSDRDFAGFQAPGAACRDVGLRSSTLRRTADAAKPGAGGLCDNCSRRCARTSAEPRTSDSGAA